MEPKALWAVYYPLGYLIAKYVARYTRLSPNSITFLVLLFAFVPMVSYAIGSYNGIALAGILIQFIIVGDVVDGRVAELNNKSTSLGEWIDGMVALIADGLVFGGIGYGIYQVTGNVQVWHYIYAIIVFNYLIYLAHKIYLMIDPGFRKTQGSQIQENIWVSVFIWGRAKVYILTGVISVITGFTQNIIYIDYFTKILAIMNMLFFILLFAFFSKRLMKIDKTKVIN